MRSNAVRFELFIAFMVACYIFPLVAGGIIYLRYNLSAISTLGISA